MGVLAAGAETLQPPLLKPANPDPNPPAGATLAERPDSLLRSRLVWFPQTNSASARARARWWLFVLRAWEWGRGVRGPPTNVRIDSRVRG